MFTDICPDLWELLPSLGFGEGWGVLCLSAVSVFRGGADLYVWQTINAAGRIQHHLFGGGFIYNTLEKNAVINDHLSSAVPDAPVGLYSITTCTNW